MRSTAGLSRTAMPLPSLLLLALLALAAVVHALGARVDQLHSGIVRPPSHIPEAGLITHLPGYHGHLPSRHYGGYITVNKAANRNLYYYLVGAMHSSASQRVHPALQLSFSACMQQTCTIDGNQEQPSSTT